MMDDEGMYSPPDRGEGAKTVDEQEQEPQTALLPKSILGGKTFKEGEEVVLKIVKDHGDEIEVSYAPEKSRGPDTGRSQPPIPADDELAAMDTGE